MRNIKYIVIHCTATLPTATVESIKNGFKALGWKNPGYHYLVDCQGLSHNLLNTINIANGVKGYNSCSIHIAYIGGIDRNGNPKNTMTPAQKKRIQQQIEMLLIAHPQARVVGHRDLSPDKNKNGKIEPTEWLKACPCFDVKTEFNIPKENLK